MTFALVIHRLVILLCLQLFPTIVETYHNISLGSSLIASDDNSSWLSPSGDFAFGFQRIGTEGFLLSIWFNNIPEKTIVWYARTRTETLLQKGSKVELTNGGDFLLYDNQGLETWNSFKHRVAYASMLDTGNFVLINEDFVTIWQSFGDQTDTILPTQILDRGTESVLVSRHTQTNYSRGRFQLQLQPDGNLELYAAYDPSVAAPIYWESSTKQTGFQLVFNQSGHIYLTQTNGSILINLTPANVTSTSNFYHRATLDYDGVLRQYVYPKISMTGETSGVPKSWFTVWSVPPDICSSLKDPWGSGACGYNSYCRQDENQRPTCECPPGYNYTDPSNKLGGCSPNFVPQSCSASSQEAHLFDMKEIPQTDFAGHDYENLISITEESCKEACLNDCLCAIALFRDEVCWKKGFPFTNGIMEVGMSGKIMVKVGRENFSHHSDNDLNNDHTSTKIFIKQLLLSGSMAINLIFMSATILFTMWRYHNRTQKVLPYMLDMNVQAFTYKELALATNSFKEELGRGASATVYKAVLASGQRHIAAGRLDLLVEDDEEVIDDMKRLEKLVMIAIWCIQEEPTLRPTMYKVTQMLEGVVDVCVPPNPCTIPTSD
ncbi:G-type lectin S-receptor-like serine/threonine-protein kinase LECRK3 [Thalictrum thalictroides]|uniref:G-type lectin S-receptor-like serine/threonine-protein kinase LECRK3 n=1 Tax=Thalictrum thalictroides TaxID=46969 RepID=A0A7J6X445_THATH|nr:G-type lectin S-receptor-like serine/threonine-protein kinase LECRK3 [Thalictrum thalictroides]